MALVADPLHTPRREELTDGDESVRGSGRELPDGWDVAFGEAARQECLDYIEENWTDMRPASLIMAMEEDARQRNGARSETVGAGIGSSAD